MQKRAPIGWMLLAALAAVVTGCAGQPLSLPPGPVSLDQWLAQDAFDSIVAQLKNNTFLKQRPILIVKARGEQVSDRIDRLTEDVRERLLPRLRAHPQIRVVFRHPASGVDRPYRVQELQCANFQEVSLFLAIDIKQIGPSTDHLARISIGAIDIGKGEWVEGFSLYQSAVRLTAQQSRDLGASHPDEYLRGSRYLPFQDGQQDEMAAYLARNLSCIFRDAYGGPGKSVFVSADPEAGANTATVARLLEKQLNFNNEIQLANSPSAANWVVSAEALETGTGTGLYQVWVDVSRREDGQLVKGLATHAYFEARRQQANGISGTWELRNPADNQVVGLLQVQSGASGRYTGDLFAPDGRTQKKLGIDIAVDGNNVGWIYYVREEQKTYEVSGVLGAGGKRMAVKQSAIPTFEPPRSLELIRIDSSF